MDIAASRAFYEKLGFRPIGGDQAQNWLILMLLDPDGNPILIDQHVPSPRKLPY